MAELNHEAPTSIHLAKGSQNCYIFAD